MTRGLGIVADGSGSVAGPGASISSYKFVFSDGANNNYSTGAQEQPSVEYPSTNGTDTVTLTVTNSAGQPPHAFAVQVVTSQRPKFTGWVFVNPEHDRWRIWCEHKQAGRGVLDRTLTAATLERMYAAALAAGDREVVLS